MKCTCTVDQTTGNTEFQKGILSCNICGKEVTRKEERIESLLKELKSRYTHVCREIAYHGPNDDILNAEINILVTLLRHYQNTFNLPNLGI